MGIIRGTGRRGLSSIMALILLAWPSAALAAPLSDISGNWAEAAILRLVDAGIVDGYPDGTFRPERQVSRAEFAKLLATAFDPEAEAKEGSRSFPDVDGWALPFVETLSAAGIVEGFPDGTFRPKAPVTHAEAIQMILRLLGADALHGYPAPDAEPTFRDVPRTHWAFEAAELSAQIGILPPYNVTLLEPDRPASRAEVAYMIDAARSLEVVRGTVVRVSTDPPALEVRTATGDPVTLEGLTPATDAAGRPLGRTPVILRNTIVSEIGAVQPGDTLYAIVDGRGRTRLLDARGEISSNDVAEKLAGYARGWITPQALKAIIAGDWAAAGDALKSSLYNQLLAMGTTPLEAEAILHTDWRSLGSLARERLAGALGRYLGISPELATALLNQDWATARELAQTEAVQLLLNELLFAGQAGQDPPTAS